MAYHMLFTRESAQEPWAPQFGDYERQVVVDERADSYGEYPRRNTKIVRMANARGSSVTAAMHELNGGK